MADAGLDGRVIVVTGAGSGMGAAMAQALLSAGATVVGVDVDGAALVRLQLVTAGDRLKIIEADLSDRSACEQMISRARSIAGGLHGLVNNAGVGMAAIDKDYSVRPVRFWEADVARWERLMNINVRAPLVLAQAAARIFIDQGFGRIVNVTTSLDTMLFPNLSAYGQSKAALEAASASWASELQGTGVTVNVLTPGGPVDTAFLPATTRLPREKLIQPHVMGPPIVWLMNDEANGFTNRRIVARHWAGPNVTRADAERMSAPAAWAGYGPQAVVPD